jgi:catechol 2,3-dioxygenase-like lactoylglutathione lyase family enzyme
MADNEQLVTVAPEFFVRDVRAAVEFYVEKLGFVVLRENDVFAVIALGQAHVLLAHESIAPEGSLPEPSARGSGLNVRIVVDDVDAVYERAKARGVSIIHDIADRSYGLRDFILADPDGFMLRFAAPVRASG